MVFRICSRSRLGQATVDFGPQTDGSAARVPLMRLAAEALGRPRFRIADALSR
jgi:hypothetical protein